MNTNKLYYHIKPSYIDKKIVNFSNKSVYNPSLPIIDQKILTSQVADDVL